MAIDRVPLADWEAIAAMPGLELLAEVFEPFCRRDDPLSMLVFTAAQWPAGSRTQLHSWFSTTNMWESVRASAARVGRQLPTKAPTQDQLDKMRREMSERDATELMQRFAVVAREVTEVVGSRSRTGNPRVSPFHETSAKGNPTNHVPVIVAGVHGGKPQLQCVLGIGVYPDMAEESTAMAVLRHVHDVHGSCMHAMFYDRLLSGRSMRELMLRHVVPNVDMKDSGANGVKSMLRIPKPHNLG